MMSDKKTMLTVSNLTVKYGDTIIVDDVSFEAKEGEWLVLVGPNGAGKSTIVNAVSGGADYTGTVFFEQTDLKKCKAFERALNIGVLSQNHNVGYSFTVEEVVRLGRYAYSKGRLSSNAGDTDAVKEALELTGLTELADHSVLTLSGGELQRTFLAQLFAQNPKILILDEPTNHLDLIYQKQILEIVRDWVKVPGRSVISVIHDLSLAKKFGTQALLLGKGRVKSYGSVDEVLTKENLAEVYGMDVFGWMHEMHSAWEK